MGRFLVVLVVAACARGAAASGPATGDPARLGDPRTRLVEAARRHLGRRFAGDCSGFVRRVFAEARVALPPPTQGRSRSETLYRSLSPVPRPSPGDLTFFHGTYDRDRAGQQRDRFTHVALVEATDGAHVTLIHRGSRGIERIRMNLARRHDPDENGRVRRRRAADRPGLRYLSGELFAGYATALVAPPRIASTPRRHEDVSVRSRGRHRSGLD